ncbi:hypothetical protein CROQUDRAFT_719039 [Cronartium quercuum f. sp. fusiforme G11]|uniref:Uncharacterized protein n=1 Tax=Cronartium quercuum f. sp. fusiforme G11 TaxID=708437 RepID=A0A9P6N8T3_9BASI|nr:hypothetical protein CROQUDRAFT_719039 [Cronartium quercuum f. sp. fusiforme G11]
MSTSQAPRTEVVHFRSSVHPLKNKATNSLNLVFLLVLAISKTSFNVAATHMFTCPGESIGVCGNRLNPTGFVTDGERTPPITQAFSCAGAAKSGINCCGENGFPPFEATRCVPATPPLDNFECTGATPYGVCGPLFGGKVTQGGTAALVRTTYSCDGLHQIQASCCGSIDDYAHPSPAYYCTAVTPN